MTNSPERPDLTGVPIEVLAYIQALEAQLEASRGKLRVRETANGGAAVVEFDEILSEPSEPPTAFNLITMTAGGLIKRTPRHLYDRQRRGGMGVFDLDAPDDDPPALLSIADVGQTLIVVTTQGRAFPLPVAQLAESPVRARGESLRKWVPLTNDERIALVTPDMAAGYLTVVTRRGQVRRWRYNVFGRNLQPGTILYEIREGGLPAAACWTQNDGDLFIATSKGLAIRFAEAQVPVRGCLGIRIDPDDAVVGVAGVSEASGVFLLADDGKGTIRQMAGFSLNKAPGAGGKIAMKADRLIGAGCVSENSDIFAISKLGKIIRFRANEAPAKEGAVQGVNCMALRADQVTAVAVCETGNSKLEAGSWRNE
jgi:DNA gyrase subunit A